MGEVIAEKKAKSVKAYVTMNEKGVGICGNTINH